MGKGVKGGRETDEIVRNLQSGNHSKSSFRNNQHIPFCINVSELNLQLITTGPCHEAVNYEPFHAMCIEDVSACVKASKEGCVCNSMMQYSRLCVSKGVVLKWRTDEFCRKLFLFICFVDLVNFHLHSCPS